MRVSYSKLRVPLVRSPYSHSFHQIAFRQAAVLNRLFNFSQIPEAITYNFFSNDLFKIGKTVQLLKELSLVRSRFHLGFSSRRLTTRTPSNLARNVAYQSGSIMARNLAEASSGSSLSPPPANLASVTDDTVSAGETAPTSRKRKASTAAKSAVKRTKPTAEAEEEAEISTEETVPVKKKIPLRKKKATEPQDEDEEDAIAPTPKAKKNPTKRSSKKPDETPSKEPPARKVSKRKGPTVKKLEPLAERTKESKVRVGAHVSAAGGTFGNEFRAERVMIVEG